MNTNNDELNHLSPEERLRAENELMKLKMSAEQGAKFFNNEEKEINPFIENQWLNYIQEFERQHENVKQTTVHAYIGSPAFEIAENLSDEQLLVELDRLEEIMGNNGVNLDFLCEYDTKTKYKFITEELFIHEIDDIHIEGMMNCFIYEEFHRNHEYDLIRLTDDFLDALLLRKWNEYDDIHLCDQVSDHLNTEFSKKDFISKINKFQDAFQCFEILNKKMVSVNFDLQSEFAELIVDLHYKAATIDREETISFSGKAIFNFSLEYDYWSIKKVNIPGFF